MVITPKASTSLIVVQAELKSSKRLVRVNPNLSMSWSIHTNIQETP